jgi:tetratricopeptide (TPR) repeat protein
MRSLVIASLVCVSLAARADSSSEAREHFKKATAHYAIGEFAEAASEYEAAFKAKQDPALLYNAAQAHRLAGHQEKALVLYRNFVQLYPSEPNIAEVRMQIDKLREAIAVADKAKTAPPTGTAEPRPPVAEGRAAPAPTPTPAPVEEKQPAPAPVTKKADKKPVYKQWWLWTIVGVVVAGAAVGTAVALTVPSGSWNNVPDVGPGSANGLAVGGAW